MTRAFHPSAPGFLPSCPPALPLSSICVALKDGGRGKRTIRCGPHQRVVNELRRRREKCSFDRHFTRHSGFLSPPSFSILNTFADRFFLRPNRPAQTVRSTPDMICHISTLSICCHITAAENYQENSGGHRQRRQRLLAHPRSSPQPISFNRSKEGRKRGRKEGRKEGVPCSCEQNMARLSSHALHPPSLPHFRVSSQSVSRLRFLKGAAEARANRGESRD